MTTVHNRDLGFTPDEFDSNPVDKAYRDALADALETVLDNGADTLEAIVSALNELSVTAPGGMAWTPALLESELTRLGR
jgi:hypothetical protein